MNSLCSFISSISFLLSLLLNLDLTVHQQTLLLTYFNLRGVEHKWEVEEKGGRGRENEKHKEVAGRKMSFFNTMCDCKIFISSAIQPPFSPLVFFTPSLSACTSPGRFESTDSELYHRSIDWNQFPRFGTVAMLSWELVVSFELPESIRNEHLRHLSLVCFLLHWVKIKILDFI